MRCALMAVLLAACVACAGPRDRDEAFERGAGRAPTVRTLVATARILARQGRHEEAEAVFFQLVELHPDHAPGWNELAELHLGRGELGQAVVILERATERCPDDAVLWNNLGMCHFLRSDYESSLEPFRRALAVDPGDARARANLGTALGLLGNWEGARAELIGCLGPAEAHHNLGVIAEARGETTRAVREFALARQLGR